MTEKFVETYAFCTSEDGDELLPRVPYARAIMDLEAPGHTIAHLDDNPRYVDVACCIRSYCEFYKPWTIEYPQNIMDVSTMKAFIRDYLNDHELKLSVDMVWKTFYACFPQVRPVKVGLFGEKIIGVSFKRNFRLFFPDEFYSDLFY